MTKQLLISLDKNTVLKSYAIESANTNLTSTMYDLNHKEETIGRTYDKCGMVTKTTRNKPLRKNKTKSEYSRDYRIQNKIKLNNLCIEKYTLEISVSSLLEQPFFQLFNSIPCSLTEFKDLIMPSRTTFDNIDQCKKFISQLGIQRQTYAYYY